MENLNKIEYVLYEAEKGNEYIESISRLSDVVRKIIRTETGAVMEEIYDFSKYKNVRTLADLSKALEENEYLAIVLDENTRDLVNPNNIIEYIDHEPKETVKKETVREIGDKLYLIKYDEFSLAGLGADTEHFIYAQVKMNPDETCSIEGIHFTSKSKKELDENLSFQYGGYSGLYFLTSSKEMIDKYADTYYEATKTTPDSWEVIKLTKKTGEKKF